VTDDTTQALAGGFLTSSVTRSGDIVRRSAGPWSPAVHAWLTHLAGAGLTLAPSPIRLDIASGTEDLSYMPGEVPSGGASPAWLWHDSTLAGVARLIRAFHDAAAGFRPPDGAAWQQTAAYPGGGDVICHNDLAPWNTVFSREGEPAALIDWDLAAPGPRWWDVSYAIWHFVPLYGAADSDPFDLAVFEPRARRTRLFCDAYGLTGRDELPGQIVARQNAVRQAIGDRADAGDPAYQRLRDLGAEAGIDRQASYVQDHQAELASALE
jgi:hypothetical protein